MTQGCRLGQQLAKRWYRMCSITLAASDAESPIDMLHTKKSRNDGIYQTVCVGSIPHECVRVVLELAQRLFTICMASTTA